MDNKTIQTKPYTAPLIEVIDVKLEQGFATSYGNGSEPIGSRKDDFAW